MTSSAKSGDGGASAEAGLAPPAAPAAPAAEVGGDVLVEPCGASQPQTAQPAASHVVRPASRKRLGKGVRVSVTRASVDSATEDPGIKARIANMGKSAMLFGTIESGNSKSGPVGTAHPPLLSPFPITRLVPRREFDAGGCGDICGIHADGW